MDHHALPEGLASRNEPRVMLALGLVELVVLERLEMKRSREIKRIIDNRTPLCPRWRTDIAALEIRNLCEQTNFRGEELSLCRSEIFA